MQFIFSTVDTSTHRNTSKTLYSLRWNCPAVCCQQTAQHPGGGKRGRTRVSPSPRNPNHHPVAISYTAAMLGELLLVTATAASVSIWRQIHHSEHLTYTLFIGFYFHWYHCISVLDQWFKLRKRGPFPWCPVIFQSEFQSGPDLEFKCGSQTTAALFEADR